MQNFEIALLNFFSRTPCENLRCEYQLKTWGRAKSLTLQNTTPLNGVEQCPVPKGPPILHTFLENPNFFFQFFPKSENKTPLKGYRHQGAPEYFHISC